MAKITHTLNRAGNLDDVRNSIRSGWNNISVDALKKALADELKNQKRSSFISLLESYIKKKKKDQLEENSITTIIHFEDHDQDFLQWFLDKDGMVIRSEPFQTTVWKGVKVLNIKDLKTGDFVWIRSKKMGQVDTTINYRCEKIEEVNNG